MSKAIRSYPEGERKVVINRRLKNKTGGLGYLAAQDAVQKGKVTLPVESKNEDK